MSEEEEEDEGIDEYDEALLEDDTQHRQRRRQQQRLREVDDDSDEEGNAAREATRKRHKPDKAAAAATAAVRYLRPADIEGQEASGHLEFDDDDGTRIEPFNMKEEFAEGNFDEGGFYTRKKDAEESHDPWLDSISAADIRKAKAAQEARLQREGNNGHSNNNNDDDDDAKREQLDRKQLLGALIELIRPDETPASALRRLRPPPKKFERAKPSFTQHKLDNEEESKKITAAITRLTELCDQLLGTGMYDVYSTSREALIEQLESEMKASKKAAGGGGVQWKYKWDEGGEVYGPFSSKEMMAWQEQNCFPNGILVSKLENGTASEFYSSKRVDFSLFDDDDE